MKLEEFLKLLQNVGPAGQGWSARCPGHDDRENSLSAAEGEKEKILVKCHAGCSPETIVKALGLQMADLFPESGLVNTGRKKDMSTPPESDATVQHGCTLEDYAAAKKLPMDFLKSLGLTNQKRNGFHKVIMPYLDPKGSEVGIRYRTGLTGPQRFRWKTGSKAHPYGVWKIHEARKAGYVVLVEGESDCHTLWFHTIPALGIPGVSTWKEEWAEYFDGIARIYLIVEPDKGGATLRTRVQNSSISDHVYLVNLKASKDVSELYLKNPGAFPEALNSVLEGAESLSKFQSREKQQQAEEAWDLCQEIAEQPRILNVFAATILAQGVAGEERVVKLLYLILTSRFLERPISAVVKGPSSGGKSFLTEQVLDFFPETAYHALSAMSEHHLAYMDEPLRHRFLVLFEAAGIQGDFASYLVRSLLSEGRIRYGTVDTNNGQPQGRLLEQEGPTGLLLTTTRVGLHPENETRLLSIPVNDTPEQTKAILYKIGLDAEEGPSSDILTDRETLRWRALQTWLEGAEHRVSIPFAPRLSEEIPPDAIRLRRDFTMVLNLIKTHAILHRANRKRDANEQIIATLEDYEVVRELVGDLIASGIEASVSQPIRDTVGTVRDLLEGEGPECTVSIRQLTNYLNLDKSTVSRRVKEALSAGYLVNEEKMRGKPYKLKVGDRLPEEKSILPTVEVLQGEPAGCCTVASESRGTPTPSSSNNEPEVIIDAD